MSAMANAAADSVRQYRHEALLYRGLDGFREELVPFLREGIDAGEAVLVVVSEEKIRLLSDALGAGAGAVTFASMDDVGANPGRIIAAWHDFVGEHVAADRAMRGVGEPIHTGRSAAEMVECHRHEALLNLAFEGTPGFWLVCPYDVAALDPAVVAEACQTHPFVSRGGRAMPSEAYMGKAAIRKPLDDPLPEPAGPSTEFPFDLDDLGYLRDRVAAHADGAGLDEQRRDDLVLACCEIATNSIRHGGGDGLLRQWVEDDTVLCEIRDSGRIHEPLVGRIPPDPSRPGGRGVWLANQLCDLVQIRALQGRNVVRLHMRL
jgi:anti-sigma regulatory factor (Ser/Thr protein kinase)